MATRTMARTRNPPPLPANPRRPAPCPAKPLRRSGSPMAASSFPRRCSASSACAPSSPRSRICPPRSQLNGADHRRSECRWAGSGQPDRTHRARPERAAGVGPESVEGTSPRLVAACARTASTGATSKRSSLNSNRSWPSPSARSGVTNSSKASVPQKEIEAARFELEAWKKRRAAVGASISAAEPLRAPVSGVISATDAVAGQVVEAQGDPVRGGRPGTPGRRGPGLRPGAGAGSAENGAAASAPVPGGGMDLALRRRRRAVARAGPAAAVPRRVNAARQWPSASRSR